MQTVTIVYLVASVAVLSLSAVCVLGVRRYLKCLGQTAQLEAEHSHWKRLLENAVLVVGCDCAGRINYVNPFCSTTYGYSTEELVGRSFDDIFSPKDFKRGRPGLGTLLAGETTDPSVEMEITTKNGETHNISWSGVVLKDLKGTPAGTISLGLDITRVRIVEAARDEALRQLNKLKKQVESEGLSVEATEEACRTGKIIGQSDAIRYVLQKIKQVAKTDATVLIEGETGVGKELVARALHDSSGRVRGPFVPVNCAALAPTLIESELFGHEKGAFTGADRFRKGRFEMAEGGTLFLDEIGELPLEMQVKLLRVLQEGEYERVGDSRIRQTNVRVISASNRDLREEVKAGRFREDLFYRLQVYPITVPPLRDRPEDIPLLVSEFVRRLSAKYGKKIDQIPGHVLEKLKNRPWSGNVRELMNFIEQAVITTNGQSLILPKERTLAIQLRPTPITGRDFVSLASAERSYIARVLEHTGGKIAGQGGAAEILEIHPNTLRTRMGKLGMRKRVSKGLSASAIA